LAESLTPDILLKAYAAGIFPMAESADDPNLHWIDPKLRGVIPLQSFHVSGKLAQLVRSEKFEISISRDFKAVIRACAAPVEGRENTWINDRIIALYSALHSTGHAHSVEVRQSGALVGGLYGVTLGRVYFGESMFHTARDASKVALVHLVARLIQTGFCLLDTQFVTEHLMQFGAVEIPRRQYRLELAYALQGSADFLSAPLLSGEAALSMISDLASDGRTR
jgi:leucyl/phenylalanyl-tRNA---protein transferase